LVLVWLAQVRFAVPVLVLNVRQALHVVLGQPKLQSWVDSRH